MTVSRVLMRCAALLLALPLLFASLPAALAEDIPVRHVAITVDDGPDGLGCSAYLAISRQFDVPLTFFLVGQNVPSRGTQVRAMLAAGCEVGNHSWSHPRFADLTPEAVQKEVADTNQAILKAAPDAAIRFVRAPYFSYSDAARAAVGYPLIDASRYEADSSQYEKTLKELLSARDGDIYLLHCWNNGSIRALKEAIPQMQAEGVVFVTVSQLFEVHGVTPEAGRVYRNVRPATP